MIVPSPAPRRASLGGLWVLGLGWGCMGRGGAVAFRLTRCPCGELETSGPRSMEVGSLVGCSPKSSSLCAEADAPSDPGRPGQGQLSEPGASPPGWGQGSGTLL